MDVFSQSTLKEFILYNNWANQEVLRACQNLSADQMEAVIPGAYGTVRGTLQHIIGAEAHYVNLLTGSSPELPFKWEARPDLADVAAYATQVGDALLAAAEHVLPTARVVEEADGKQFYYQALAVFIQIINHGVEHRTNITTILNQGPQTPPKVDGWGYLDTHLDRFELK